MLKQIARGGMGVVYLGTDERLQRPVCVKLLHVSDASRSDYPTVLEHFIQEAFTLSRLVHPNTLRIYDFGYFEGEQAAPFFVTEYADGGNLQELIRNHGALSPAATLQIVKPMAGALREAHDHHVFHRDIKPSNILFANLGGHRSPKLADFSIAKALSDIPHRADDTNSGVSFYSLGWAAPEQLVGGPIGPEADVFALALTTAYMLSGRKVYPGKDIIRLYSMRRLGAKFREEIIRDMGLPAKVVDVLLVGSAERIDDRYRDVASFCDAFEESLASAPLGASEAMSVVPLGEAHHEGAAPRPTPLESPGMPLAAPVESHGSEAPMLHARLPPRPADKAVVLRGVDRPSVDVNGRTYRIMRVSAATVTLHSRQGGDLARFRATPIVVRGPHVHIKGLNCFVRRGGMRLSSGVDVAESGVVELVAPTSLVEAELRIHIAEPIADGLSFALGAASLVVPAALAAWAVIIETTDNRGGGLLLYAEPRTSP